MRKILPLPMYNFINQLYYNPNNVIIPKNLADYIVLDEFKYKITPEVHSIVKLNNKFKWFKNTRETDIVLDIGACIGAFAIPVSFRSKLVYAIEPLWNKELYENIKLNKIENIIVWKYGIGKEEIRKIQYGDHSEIIKMQPMEYIIGLLPKFDIIKCDCEGAEWSFSPECFKDAREIHMEFHIRKKHKIQDTHKMKEWINWFQLNRYKWERISDNTKLGRFCAFSRNTADRFYK
jgi:hypothetical protein